MRFRMVSYLDWSVMFQRKVVFPLWLSLFGHMWTKQSHSFAAQNNQVVLAAFRLNPGAFSLPWNLPSDRNKKPWCVLPGKKAPEDRLSVWCLTFMYRCYVSVHSPDLLGDSWEVIDLHTALQSHIYTTVLVIYTYTIRIAYERQIIVVRLREFSSICQRIVVYLWDSIISYATEYSSVSGEYMDMTVRQCRSVRKHNHV